MGSAEPTERPLTPKQQRFVEEYLVDLNATQAAIRAGYGAKNANVIGPRLLANDGVIRAIALGRQKLSETTGITVARVLRELEMLAFSNHQDYLVDDTGVIQLREGVPQDAHRAISAVKRRFTKNEDGSITTDVEVKLWDKPGMVRLAGKHLGIKGFADTLSIDPSGLPAPVVQVFTGCAPPAEVAEEEEAAEKKDGGG